MTQRLGMTRQPRTTRQPRMSHHLQSVLPQRGNVFQPRVAALPLPWVWITINYSTNPNGVAAEMAEHRAKDTTPLGLVGLGGCFPRVAGSPQPWGNIEGWNPVGIQTDSPSALPQRGIVPQPSALPQRGNVPQPRVAAEPLPWDNAVTHFTNPNGVAAEWATRSAEDTTPLGLAGLGVRCPKVAAKPQPWAEGWNPVGIPGNLRAEANPIGTAVHPSQSKLPGELSQSKLPAKCKQFKDMPQKLPSALPQRGNVLQPRVAASPLPWVCGVIHTANPNGVVSLVASAPITTAKQRASIVRAEMEDGK